jgi:hypothetical protein
MLSKINLKHYLTIALSIAIFTTPLGVLTIKSWAGYHLFICALLSIILLWTNRQHLCELDFSNQIQMRIITWVSALPFLARLAFFIRLYRKNQSSQLTSGLGVIYLCIELISCLSIDILSLKSTASLYGLMIVFLATGSPNMKTPSPE